MLAKGKNNMNKDNYKKGYSEHKELMQNSTLYKAFVLDNASTFDWLKREDLEYSNNMSLEDMGGCLDSFKRVKNEVLELEISMKISINSIEDYQYIFNNPMGCLLEVDYITLLRDFENDLKSELNNIDSTLMILSRIR